MMPGPGGRDAGAGRCPPPRVGGSDPRFEHQVEGRLGRAAEAAEAGLACDLAEPRLAGLRAEGQPTSWASDAGVQSIVEAQ